MSLTNNIGKTDRAIRPAVAGLLVLLGIWLHQPILSVIGLVLVVTGATGFCLVYIPFKFSTNKDGQD
jgi:Zn-dependent membrane protease YugP